MSKKSQETRVDVKTQKATKGENKPTFFGKIRDFFVGPKEPVVESTKVAVSQLNQTRPRSFHATHLQMDAIEGVNKLATMHHDIEEAYKALKIREANPNKSQQEDYACLQERIRINGERQKFIAQYDALNNQLKAAHIDKNISVEGRAGIKNVQQRLNDEIHSTYLINKLYVRADSINDNALRVEGSKLTMDAVKAEGMEAGGGNQMPADYAKGYANVKDTFYSDLKQLTTEYDHFSTEFAALKTDPKTSPEILTELGAVQKSATGEVAKYAEQTAAYYIKDTPVRVTATGERVDAKTGGKIGATAAEPESVPVAKVGPTPF